MTPDKKFHWCWVDTVVVAGLLLLVGSIIYGILQ